MSLVLFAAVVGREILGMLLSLATGLPVTTVVTEIAQFTPGRAVVCFEFEPYLSTAETNELIVRRKTASTGWARDVSRKVNAYFSVTTKPTKLFLHSFESPAHAICSLKFSDF